MLLLLRCFLFFGGFNTTRIRHPSRVIKQITFLLSKFGSRRRLLADYIFKHAFHLHPLLLHREIWKMTRHHARWLHLWITPILNKVVICVSGGAQIILIQKQLSVDILRLIEKHQSARIGHDLCGAHLVLGTAHFGGDVRFDGGGGPETGDRNGRVVQLVSQTEHLEIWKGWKSADQTGHDHGAPSLESFTSTLAPTFEAA